MNKYIKVTKETEKEVLEVLEKLGYKWVGGALPTTYSIFKYNNPITVYINIEESGLTWDSFRGSDCCGEEIYPNQLTNKLNTIITKLKDLHGLVSTDGRCELRFAYDEFNSTDKVYAYDLRGKSENKYEILTIRELSKCTLNKLDFLGFNLIYKPPRTKEEIFEEIEKLAELPNENEGRYRVYFGYPRIDEFNVRKIDTSAISYPRIKGIKKEDAERLCNELNNLKEVK